MFPLTIQPRQPLSAVTLILSLVVGSSAMAQVQAETVEQEQVEAVEQEKAEEKDESGGNFLILPVLITEPAIGEGLGLGFVYFHRNRDPDMSPISTPSNGTTSPTTTPR